MGFSVTHTPFGQVTRTPDGWTHIDARASELKAWATKPGGRWPCSTLATLDGLAASFAPNGDLVDTDLDGVDPEASEFNAWADDCRSWRGA